MQIMNKYITYKILKSKCWKIFRGKLNSIDYKNSGKKIGRYMGITAVSIFLIISSSASCIKEANIEEEIEQQIVVGETCQELPVETSDQEKIIFDLNRAINPANTVQLLPEIIEIISMTFSKEDNSVLHPQDFSIEEFPWQGCNMVFKDLIPYYPYLYLPEGKDYVFHPMALGRFLIRNTDSTIIDKFNEAILKTAVELPNNGLAWYYPNHFQVERMRGGELKYSCISQGVILSGFTKLGLEVNDDYFKIAQLVFKGMQLPFNLGGINLEGVSLLEMPSYRSAPEIILNGWIDALLHINDYRIVTGDAKAQEFLVNNLNFLAKIIENFDLSEFNISRYSCASPYRIKIILEEEAESASVKILYQPKYEELEPLVIDLEASTNSSDSTSIYDNHIVNRNGNIINVWVSCNQLYDTVIISSSGNMTVEFNAGILSRLQTTPGSGGEHIILKSRPINTETYKSYINLNEVTNKMICGYPTNFKKDGNKNYYHVYHVVSLMLLALSISDISEKDLQKELLHWALKWLEYINIIEEQENLSFIDLQDMLDSTNLNKTLITYTSIDKLISDSLERYDELAFHH